MNGFFPSNRPLLSVVKMLLNTGYLTVFIVNNNATGRVRHMCWLQETQKASRNPIREQEPQEIRKERGGSILQLLEFRD